MRDKVVLITGVARGQGRAHAIRLARAGANIVGLDICAPISTMDYPNASVEDLERTVYLVEATGREILARPRDVREPQDLETLVADSQKKFGRLDAIIANAGIVRLTPGGQRRQVWQDIIDVNLTGVWNTIEVGLPAMRGAGRGGSIVLTSSTAGLKAMGGTAANGGAYSVAKRGLIALMQLLALELAPEWISVNTIHPTGVASGITLNPTMHALMDEAARGGSNTIATMLNALPISMLSAEDIANAVAWLLSEEARYITGSPCP
jgi:SDR family mycofactocin-dependent oxidoreductase